MLASVPELTVGGKSLLIRAINGEHIEFTRFWIGNGELEDTAPEDLKNLINPVFDFKITEATKSDAGYIELTGRFNSEKITSDFRWRELGVYAKGEDGIEMLYAYSNDGDNAGMLKANASDVLVEQTVSLIVAIGDAEHVTALISPSAMYASKEAFDQHVSDPAAHAVTAEMVGLGNVPNVRTNDQTPTYTEGNSDKSLVSGEKLSVAMGKIAHAINRLWAHLKDRKNPHKTGLFAAAAVDFVNAWGDPDVISTFTGNGASAATLSVNGTNCRGQYINLGFNPSKVVIIIPYGSITIGHSQSQLLYSSGLFDILIGRAARIAVIGPMMNYYHDGCGNYRSTAPQSVLTRNHGGAVVYDKGFIVQSYYNGDTDTTMYMNVKNVVYTYLAWK